MHSLKYLGSTTFDCKDVGARTSEFVAKTQFLYLKFSTVGRKKGFYGEGLSSDSQMVLTVKTHGHTTEKGKKYQQRTFNTVLVVYTNTRKTTFYSNFAISIFQTAETRKHINKEKLSINSFYLFTCKLGIWKMLVRDHSIVIKKLSCHYNDKIAIHLYTISKW